MSRQKIEVRNQKLRTVIPTKLVPAWFKRGVGIQSIGGVLDLRLHGNDDLRITVTVTDYEVFR